MPAELAHLRHQRKESQALVHVNLGNRLTLGVSFQPTYEAGILAAGHVLIRRPLKIDLLQRVAIPSRRKVMGVLEGRAANPYNSPPIVHLAKSLAVAYCHGDRG